MQPTVTHRLAWSVCLSVCLSRSRALQKRLNRSRCRLGMDLGGPMKALLYWGAHWGHLANTIETSICSDDAAFCRITLSTCYYYYKAVSLPLLIALRTLLHIFLLPFVELLWIRICKSAHLTSLRDIFKQRFQLPNENTFVRSVRLKIGIHEIHLQTRNGKNWNPLTRQTVTMQRKLITS